MRGRFSLPRQGKRADLSNQGATSPLFLNLILTYGPRGTVNLDGDETRYCEPLPVREVRDWLEDASGLS